MNGSLSSSATSITLNAVTGLQNTTGLGVIDRVDSSGTLTPSKREYVYWTSISGSALTLPNTSDGRGAAGSTAQSHADGAIFEEILGVDEWNGLITAFSAQHADAGTHSAITATSLSVTSLASNSFPAGVTPLMMLNGMVKNRQGGTSGDGTWITSGTTNVDTSAKNVFIQAGSNTGSSSADVTVTFPTAFTQIPLVFLYCYTNTQAFCNIVSTSTTTVVLSVRDVNAARLATGFYWVAIGQ